MKFNAIVSTCASLAFCAVNLHSAEPDWRPVPDKMMTSWGEKVTPKNVWTEYPRPQFVRKEWKNLNGLWDYAVTSRDIKSVSKWDGKILVPFCLESALSGVGRELQDNEFLWYRRSFEAKPRDGRRVLLNFEAVDYHTTVWVNGQQVGEHTGGNIPFQFDITSALKKGDNELLVRVWDVTGETQLRGKQALRPEGIWYTRVSGIWQTVWTEEAPAAYLSDIKTVTKISPAVISITPTISGADGAEYSVRATARFKGRKVASATGSGGLTLNVADAKLWSPAHPNLYDLEVELLNAKGKVVDSIKSYAGIREVGQTKDANGHLRFTLNGEQSFHWGPLDQGWWPDGLLTPPSDEAMCWDVDYLKAAGFNMIRKHIKVEPRRFYAYCDQVGIMLWQDQPAGGVARASDGRELSPPWTKMEPNPRDAVWTDAEHAQWMKELQAMIDELHNHPCIVVWVPFNEAWGQHRTVDVGNWTVAYDPTRLVNVASGGNFWPAGHIADFHAYPHPSFPFEQKRFNDYIKVVGEFGGHGWLEPEHLWFKDKGNWGYGGLPKTKEEYYDRYATSLKMLAELKDKGISGGVYTQTTDVEGELNGLITYDRKVIKFPSQKLAEMHQQLGEEIAR